MTLFWLVGAGLAAAVVAALAWALLRDRRGAPLSRGDANLAVYRHQARELDAELAAGKLGPEEHERARRELEARLLEEMAAPAEGAPARRVRGTTAAVAALVPLCALAVYFAVGTPSAIQTPEERQAVAAEQLETMAVRLEERLRRNPDDAEGWKLLGRLFGELGRFADAVRAYSEAASRAPRDAQLLAELADALAMTRGESLEGEPEQLVRRALELDPRNLKALALAGTAAFSRRDFAGAAAYWKRMLPLVEAGSEEARTIQSSIEGALAFAASAENPLRGVVRLAPGFAGKVDPEDTVFIFARALDGPPVPLAVQRAKAGELPLEFTLDDSMAMAPGMTLSAHPRVVVSARVSKSGEAKPQPGDLQGASAPVANDAKGVTVTIDTELR